MQRDLATVRRGVSRRAKESAFRTRNLVFDRSRRVSHPSPELAGRPGTSTLDLGCGRNPANPFDAESVSGVDIVDFGEPRIRVADLAVDPIPFDDQSMDFVTAFDFFEHIPRLIYLGDQRRSPFIELLNEIHRVLKPGGVLHAQTPAYPRAEAFGDPTHVNTISKQTVAYFSEASHHQLSSAYGFTGEFELIDQYWHHRLWYHLVWQLRAVHK